MLVVFHAGIPLIKFYFFNKHQIAQRYSSFGANFKASELIFTFHQGQTEKFRFFRNTNLQMEGLEEEIEEKEHKNKEIFNITQYFLS